MSFGMVEMVLVLVVVLMLFGVGKLPQVMGDLAKGVRNFRDGLKDGPETGAASAAGSTAEVPRLEHRPENRDSLVR
jgi:sec-independent protein translocase protein TatA